MTREEQIAHMSQTNAVLNLQPALEWAREQGYQEAMAVLCSNEEFARAHEALHWHWLRAHVRLLQAGRRRQEQPSGAGQKGPDRAR